MYERGIIQRITITQRYMCEFAFITRACMTSESRE